MKMPRRFAPQFAATLLAAIFSAAVAGRAQSAPAAAALSADALRVLAGPELEQQYRDMLPRYMLAQIDSIAEQRKERRDEIHDMAGLKAWQEGIRRTFLVSIGGLPQEKTPLNARVTGEVRRDGYVIRKVIFESQPELYVTANLYVPTNGKGPSPAVLCANGHSLNGKAYPIYQHVYVGLVRQGYVVLTWDNLGQGERYQLWDMVGDHSRGRDNGNEHGMTGVPEYLLGRNMAREMIWDGIRALDYLASLPEVDAERIAVTGNSGGGTLTTYISMLDPRIRVASIVTYITSFHKKVEARADDSESDPEQDLFGPLAGDVDHTEFVGLIAPRPVMLGAAIRDFFPIAGTRATFAELKQLYTQLGIPDKAGMAEFDHEHMYSQPLRENTVAWFNRWLKNELGPVHEAPMTVEDERTLASTPTGQVATSLGGQTLAGLQRAELRRLESALAARRPTLEFGRSLPARIREVLALPETAAQPAVKPAGRTEANGLMVEKSVLEPEPGIGVPLRVIKTANAPGKLRAVLYLRDRDGSGDDPALYEALAHAGRLVAVADVRGFGETKSPQNVRDRELPYYHARGGRDADLTYAAFLLGRPLIGMRVGDALAVLRVLGPRAVVEPDQIVLAGRGWAGLIAAYVGALDPKLAGLAAADVPANYAGMLRTEYYALPVSQIVPGALKEFDLQDVYASLAPRPLLLLNPVNAETRRLDRAGAKAAMAPVAAAYPQANPEPERKPLSVEVVPFEADAQERLRQWLLEH